MRARAIQVIPEHDTHPRMMPGEFLDKVSKELTSQYVFDGLAAWYIEEESPNEKAQKRSGKRRGEY